MAVLAELGSYYISVVPSLRGAAGQINSQLKGIDTTAAGSAIGGQLSSSAAKAFSVQTIGQKFTDLGKSFTDTGKKLTKGITTPILGAATAAGGLVATLGFKRLVGIDTARAQFKGLGYDADAVMKQVDAGVTNTSLSMAEGAAAATSILATGAVPLEGLEEQIKRVANVSAAYGVDASQANYLLNNVLTKQKVTWGDLSQMQQNNIPIVTALGDEFGYTGEEIQKMAENGEISIDMLNQALDSKAGAAAEEYANSWAGVTKNILSNLGKIGAKMMEPSFEIVKDKAAELLEYMKSPEFAAAAERIGQSISEFVTQAIDFIGRLIQKWNELSPGAKKIVAVMAGVAVAAGPVLVVIGKLSTGVGAIIRVIAGLAPVFKVAGVAVKLLWGALSANPIGAIVAAITAVVGALALFFTKTEMGRQIWQSICEWFQSNVMPVFEALGELFSAVGARIAEGWAILWEGLKAAWEVIGPPIITAIQTAWEVMSTILSGIWDGIKIVFTTVWNAMKTYVETILGVIKGVISAVTAAISGDWTGAWEAIKGIFSTIWEGIKSIVGTIFGGIKDNISSTLNTIRSVWTTIWNAVGGFFTGIWNGIKSGATSGIKAVYNTITGIKASITGFFSNAGSWLVDAGRNIMDGFLKGLTAAFEKVKDFVGGIGSWIADHKGPKAYDLALLVPAGGWIMEGLEDGLTNQFESVKRAVNAFGPDLESVFSANLHAPLTGAAAFGGIPATSGVGAPGGVTQNFDVHTDDPALVAAVAMDRMRRPIY